MPLSFSLPARLGAFYFAFFAYSAAYVAYFPLYLAARGLDAAEIAFVLALPQGARIFAPAAWGWAADRFGAQRAVVLLACAAMALGFALLPAAHGFAAIAIVVGVSGVFSAGALPLVEAMTLAAVAGSPGRYGPVRLWGSVGFIVVLMAGGAWLDFGPVTPLPAVVAAFGLAAFAVAAGLPRGTRPAAAHVRAPALPPGAAALLAGAFCMSVAHGALYAFFTLHLQRAGYGGAAIGALWTIGVVAEIGVFAYLPALFRRFALSTILVASFLLAGVRFLAIAWAISLLPVLVLAQLLHAATFGAFHAASVAAIHRLFPEGRHGRGQALFSSLGYGAGGAAGALVAGWAWETSGPALAFSLAALAGLAGAYFASALRRLGL